MKEISAKTIFLIVDIVAILLSIILAYEIRSLTELFDTSHPIPLFNYLKFIPFYLIPISIFAYEGIYSKRHDFWHEVRLIAKGLLFSFLIIMAYLAMSQSIFDFSRFVIAGSFAIMFFLIPLFKRITKHLLFRFGLWQTPVRVYADDPFLKQEIIDNPYLGYVESDHTEPKAVFINSSSYTLPQIRKIIESELKDNHAVNFIPLINDYDLTLSHIYGLFNTRTNLIVFENRLKSKLRQGFQAIFNYTLALLLLPLLLPIIAVIAVLIKRESPGPVFFKHERVGKGGKTIPTFKFRSMYVDAQERLEKLLEEHPEIREEWERNFKLKNDPRVTRIGAFLRRTSLDELPQIFNVLRGEMNFVGPRPVIQEEIEKYYKEYAEYYYMVKPGITGLWQVSGRSDTDYDFRIKTDKWYVSNWSLWLDIVILFKTVKVVLKKEGAY